MSQIPWKVEFAGAEEWLSAKTDSKSRERHLSAKTQGTSGTGSGVSGEASGRADNFPEFTELHNRMRVFCDLFDACRPQINSDRRLQRRPSEEDCET